MPINLLLKCHDVKTTKSFYKQILDFEVSDSAKNTCTVEKEGGIIIFTSEDLWSGYPTCTGTIYFFIDDVDKYYEAIKNKALIKWPLEDMPYGVREFGVKDYDEYTLAFAQRI
ncbi:MAG: bleomycin resistance family protein [Betaproteobacteria bacterium]|nr:bleomycin resistance family protein [Betaproteobacteria bacterium]